MTALMADPAVARDQGRTMGRGLLRGTGPGSDDLPPETESRTIRTGDQASDRPAESSRSELGPMSQLV